MKTNRGFTLVEVIGIIAILTAIVLVAFPAVDKMLKQNSVKKYETFQENIKQATRLYVERNRDLFPDLENADGTVTISVATLVDNDYVDGDLVNPNTGKNVANDSVRVTVGSDKILIYIYVEG